VAVEVFDGDTADPATLAAQVRKLKERFGLDRVVLVGGLQPNGLDPWRPRHDTSARIAADLKPAGLDWITALRAPQLRALAAGGALQMSLFKPAPAQAGERDMAAITAPDSPGERLIVCRNPALAATGQVRGLKAPERARKRDDLLAATERELARIAARVARRRQPLHGRTQIGLAVAAVIDKYQMAKHFALAITDTSFTFARNAAQIAAEAALDGLYAVPTSLREATLDNRATVKSAVALPVVATAGRSATTRPPCSSALRLAKSGEITAPPVQARGRLLRGSGGRPPARHVLHDVLPQKACDQRQDWPVPRIALRGCHQGHQPVVRDAVEIALKIGVHHPGEPRLQQPVDFPRRSPRFREGGLLQLRPGRKP
jgi:hypothetical protein